MAQSLPPCPTKPPRPQCPHKQTLCYRYQTCAIYGCMTHPDNRQLSEELAQETDRRLGYTRD